MNQYAEAYRSAVYTVRGRQDPMTVRVGERHELLDNLIKRELRGNVPECWGIITTCTPGREQPGPEASRERHVELLRDLEALTEILKADHGRDLLVLPVHATLPDGTHGADGFWIGGLSASELLVLGARCGQEAVLTGDSGSPADLACVMVSSVDACSTTVRRPFTGEVEVEAVEALLVIRDALVAGGMPTDETLAASALHWVHILEQRDILPQEVTPFDLAEIGEDLESIPGVSFDLWCDDPISVRRFAVCWPHGEELHVAVQTQDSGFASAAELNVSFALCSEDAIASLYVGEPVRWVESTDPEQVVAAADLLAWALPE